jgi:endonuclease YncB( thermonuclease family)
VPSLLKPRASSRPTYSQKSKAYLASLVLNKQVDIKVYSGDRYGQILAEVFFSVSGFSFSGVGPSSLTDFH